MSTAENQQDIRRPGSVPPLVDCECVAANQAAPGNHAETRRLLRLDKRQSAPSLASPFRWTTCTTRGNGVSTVARLVEVAPSMSAVPDRQS